MRHSYFGRKLKRNVGERRSLFMQLLRSLIEHGAIQTSIAKAKAVQPLVEKLVTKAKNATNADKNVIRKTLADKKSEDMLLSWGKTRFEGRTSGFTRIVRIGRRVGDGSHEVLLSFVDLLTKSEPVGKTTKKLEVPEKMKKVEEAVVVKNTKKVKKSK